MALWVGGRCFFRAISAAAAAVTIAAAAVISVFQVFMQRRLLLLFACLICQVRIPLHNSLELGA